MAFLSYFMLYGIYLSAILSAGPAISSVFTESFAVIAVSPLAIDKNYHSLSFSLVLMGKIRVPTQYSTSIPSDLCNFSSYI